MLKVKEVWVKFLHKELLDEFYGVSVSPRVVSYYKEKVNGNKNITNVFAINKIRRNFVVGKVVHQHKHEVHKTYGNLYIKANRNNVYSISNDKGKYEYSINKNKKKILDQIFNLNGGAYEEK